MSNEILSVLEYMEKEKGIDRADMIEAISAAIAGAAQKGVGAGQDIRVEINPRTGALKAWSSLTVVDSVGDSALEIHVEKARQTNPDAQLGEVVEQEIDPAYLGRIAAQTARQAIMQRIRQFEKDRIYDDYKDTVGDIVTGIVRRRERGDLIIDLGKAEAILPPRERVQGEDYAPGESIRCLLLKIEQTNRGPDIILSRSNINFVRRLFELEVTEIADGTVTLEAMAREAGYRTKIAVNSSDPKVDPVGACVGARGARVKTIVRELGGEKIDIIRYHADPIQLLEEALKPAVPKNIKVIEADRRIHFEVAEDDLSIAIGRRGFNAKLTSRLIGWKLDIGKEEKEAVGFDEKVAKALKGINLIPGIEPAIAQRLVSIGLISPEAFEGVSVGDLVDAEFSEEEASDVLAKVAAYLAQNA
ncbi:MULTISPECIES: transcription termination factor NusA [unclassified Lentimonas]|uniref:transcription termination factor NusA n=1 Tax=unclassified Lentimonas TaxID=2630993 RepID=UPI00132229DA|nr:MULTISPECIES: transcription termination factor NusA [unclassified Lentimonas]CAA6679973.1 Transcription termination protein NusA [Lentimonas sp. CC4]CAA6686529.1 Transcription termination protein NusA [Lentimonas sp. CC6]CAA7074805.1 Transcription termination protein NusA [Lentimonas sp. CC4]CAA7169432.1 Transcription termination protein NusA [Lentimonas sp. CC21]CAA7180177.1 Transcription termination protein NusA [Lentimonas sp. CC8]